MQLCPQAINLLNNFASINPSVYFEQGKVLRTISPGSSVIAQGNITNEIPTNFGIYSVVEFLTIIGMMGSDYQIQFNDGYINIADQSATIQYGIAADKIVNAPTNIKDFDNVICEFKLTSQMITNIRKSATLFDVDRIAIVADGKKAFIVVGRDNSNNIQVNLGPSSDKFTVVLSMANFLMMNGDYDGQVSTLGKTPFVKLSNDVVTYWLASEPKGTKLK